MNDEKKYKEALERAIELQENSNGMILKKWLWQVFPELKESDDERVRKALIDYFDDANKSDENPLYGIQTYEAIAWLEKQGEKINPYSGTSFKYNGHIWGMCARDNGVEILFDGELKAFLSSEKSFIYPIYPQPNLAPKSALEAIKEENVDNQICIKSTDKVEQKFNVGDWVVRGDTIAQILDIQEQYYIGIDINGRDFTSSRFLDDDKIHLWTIADAKDELKDEIIEKMQDLYRLIKKIK